LRLCWVSIERLLDGVDSRIEVGLILQIGTQTANEFQPTLAFLVFYFEFQALEELVVGMQCAHPIAGHEGFRRFARGETGLDFERRVYSLWVFAEQRIMQISSVGKRSGHDVSSIAGL
jgi:hypothetical protein